MHSDSAVVESASNMTRQGASETAQRPQISEAYYDQYPSCEYCGHVVFPTEEQGLNHDTLFWHSAHCFRCYGCHREFNEGLQFHVLTEIAVCNECYPRREFLSEECRSLRKGEAPTNKHPRVCFLSPVSRSATTSNSFSELQDTETDDLNPFNHEPLQPAFAQNNTRADHGYVNAETEDCPDNLSSVPRYVNGHVPRDGSQWQCLITEDTEYDETVRRLGANSVAAQMKDAMRSLSPDVEVVLPSNLIETPTRASDARSRQGREKLVVDDKFTVMAVDEWGDVDRRSPTETEYINRNVNIDEHETVWRPGAASSAQSAQNATEDPDPTLMPSRHSIRRTSSCSELFPANFESSNPFGDSPRMSYDSQTSDCPITFNTLDSDSRSEQVRGPDRCCSPSPLSLQSSTPIPQNASLGSERPPSAFDGRNDVSQERRSGRRTISPSDTSSRSDREDGEVHSFQEILAIFQKIPSGKAKKFCSYCGKEVLPMERFDCLSQVYHVRCFRCTRCRAHLNPQTFRDDGKQPYCKICFLDLKVSMNRVPGGQYSPTRHRLNSM